jgi:hypothetical protein
MSVFEYVSVMVTVVLALAVSHLLTFLATVIANPERVQVYWLHLLWAVLLLVLNLQAWLVLWTLHGQTAFPIGQVIVMVLAASLIFVAARVLVPELRHDDRVDLRAHYLRIRIPLFATLTVFWMFPFLGRLLFAGGSLFEPVSVARGVMFGLSLSGLAIKQLRWHALLAVLSGVLLVGSLAFLRSTLA